MEKKKRDILKEYRYRICFHKYECKYTILKSLRSDKKIKPLIRIMCGLRMIRTRRKFYISRQKNPCLLTGRRKGVWRFNDISRQSVIRQGNLGMLHNIKINSW